MSTSTLGYVSASENEFFAEDTIIEIMPNFERPVLRFLSGKSGPFEINVPIAIPLWLALTLKRKGRCNIISPDWLNADFLEEVKTKEAEDEAFFPLPFYYIEIAHLLLNGAKDDIKDADKVRALIKDLITIRMDRARLGILGLAGNAQNAEVIRFIGLNNMSAMEILKVKEFMTVSLDAFIELNDTTAADENRVSNVTATRASVNPVKRFRKA